jgi:antitoxin component of RelBE/YafQ-DinJ toxin-antitoxin module
VEHANRACQRAFPLDTPSKRQDESQKAMARPCRSETGEVATKVIPVRLTKSEHREIQTKKGDLSQSEYIRRAALDEDIPSAQPTPPVPAVNRQTYQALHRIGVNLNQQVKACHVAVKQGQALPIEPDQIQALADQINQVRQAVIGVDSAAESDGDHPTEP